MESRRRFALNERTQDVRQMGMHVSALVAESIGMVVAAAPRIPASRLLWQVLWIAALAHLDLGQPLYR